MIFWAIISAEIGFWACLVLGFLLRYKFKLKKVGLTLLAITPLIDIALLIFTSIDLNAGVHPDFFHGMSAAYIAFSIIFGPDIIRSLDRKFRIAHSQKENEAQLVQKQESTLKEVLRCALACIIATAILGYFISIAGFENSFWLIYWIFALLFTPLMWLLLRIWINRKNQRANNSNHKSITPNRTETNQ